MREGGREGGEGGEGGREVREGGREGDWMAGMCVKKGQWLAVSYPGRSGREESRRRSSTWLGVCKPGSHPRVLMAV